MRRVRIRRVTRARAALVSQSVRLRIMTYGDYSALRSNRPTVRRPNPVPSFAHAYGNVLICAS